MNDKQRKILDKLWEVYLKMPDVNQQRKIEKGQ